MFEAVAGGAAAAEAVARWSGRALDPAIAAVFLDSPAELLRICGPDDLWAAVVDAEPEPRRVFADEAALEEALAGFGDAADLKSPWFTGHSRGVARLARAAAGRLRTADAVPVYRAGLVHDLGRVAVPAVRGERPGPLRAEDWELVRLHPYHTGRIPARSPVLAPLGQIASRHHDGRTGPVTPAGSARPGWTGPPACSPRPTCCTRSASPGRTAPPSIRGMPRASWPGCRWIATPSGRYSMRPARPRPRCRRCLPT